MQQFDEIQLNQTEHNQPYNLAVSNLSNEGTANDYCLSEMVEKLKEQIAQLQESNRAKDKILTLVSHDIKGPLGSLHSLVSLPEEELNNEEALFVKQSIKDQVQNLNEIVDSLFRWASSAFRSNEQHEVVDLHELISKCILQLNRTAEAKKIEILNQTENTLFCDGNADQIAFSIRNILANAIKFTPQAGTVNISSSLSAEWVTLEICDDGIGMTERQLSNLFTPNQISTYGTNGEKGTGFGLWLCHDYINAHKGQIKVESKKDLGSKFFIMLPTKQNIYG